MKLLSITATAFALARILAVFAMAGQVEVLLEQSPDQEVWTPVETVPVESLDVSTDQPFFRATLTPVGGGDPSTTGVVQAGTEDPAKRVDVLLQSSTDLQTWNPVSPGLIDPGSETTFFRVQIVDSEVAADITVVLEMSMDSQSWSPVVAYPIEYLDVSADQPYYRVKIIPANGAEPAFSNVVQAATANPAKRVDVMLKKSSDLFNWLPANPGPYSLAPGLLYFAVKVADSEEPSLFRDMVLVQPGTISDPGSSYSLTLSEAYYIGQYELTLAEWNVIEAWALQNGYSFSADAGLACADDHPVNKLSWDDAIRWCNARSEYEDLDPVYTYAYPGGSDVYRGDADFDFANLTADVAKNGYRLPTYDEWEFAARGGVAATGFYLYSGSDTVEDVAWYSANSLGAACGDSNTRGTWPVGQKLPNDLDLYDMSGNVWEYIWDGLTDTNRFIVGGAYPFSASFQEITEDPFLQASMTSASDSRVGLRLVRSAAP